MAKRATLLATTRKYSTPNTASSFNLTFQTFCCTLSSSVFSCSFPSEHKVSTDIHLCSGSPDDVSLQREPWHIKAPISTARLSLSPPPLNDNNLLLLRSGALHLLIPEHLSLCLMIANSFRL